MYKHKKITINMLTCIYIVLTIIELFIYMFSKNNLFGIYYLLSNLFIIFLLVPISYNYNKYFSTARLSKLIIVLVLIIFNSFLLNLIVLKNMSYVDASTLYIDKVFVIKNILKPIIFILLLKMRKYLFKIKNRKVIKLFRVLFWRKSRLMIYTVPWMKIKNIKIPKETP